MTVRSFAPIDGAEKTIALAASSGRVEVMKGTANSYASVRVANLSVDTSWIRAGNSTVTATTSNLPIPAGVVEVLTFKIPSTGILYIAAIAGGSNGDITFSPGNGI